MKKVKNYPLLLCLGIAGLTATHTANALENNVALNNLAANTGQEIRQTINVPNGATGLSFTISGGNGDADLYVSFGSAPTTNNFGCRPYKTGNRETCSASNPTAGTYYIMVRAYNTFSGVSLNAKYVDPVNQQTPTRPAAAAPVANQPAPTNNNSNLGAVQQEWVNAHNSFRSQGRNCGGVFYPAVPPLQWSSLLGQAANGHSSDMASFNFMQHTGSNGSNAGQRITAVGYSWNTYAENIAAGQTSVAAVMQAWITSTGHCRNIMNPTVTQLGAARVDNSNSDYKRYWTVKFARPQ